MIGVGLIGFGLAGRCFHAPLVAAVEGLELHTVATSRAEAVTALHPAARVVSEPEALLRDPAVELVVIASPNRTHAPLARAAIAAGKHVVVDKPFVTDAGEGRELAALADERGVRLAVFHNRRWDSDFLTVRRVIDSGRLGELALVEMCWDRHRAAIKPGWREEPGDGAGLLADLGPHLVDQALALFGPPEALSADIGAQRGAARVDDWFDLTLHYGRLRVRLSASTLVAAPRPRFALHGTGGSFVKHGIDPQEAVLRGGGSPRDTGFGEEPRGDWGRFAAPDGRTEAVPTERGDWRRFYARMAAAIAGAAPVPVTAGEALTGLDLIALARASAAEGRRLPVTG